MSALLGWTDGSGNQVFLALDCGESEGYRNTAETSDNPVEQGSNITDNVRAAPATFALSGWITNVPVVLTGTQTEGLGQSPSALTLPSGNVSVQKFSGPFNRVGDCDALLAGLIASGTPVTVQTALRTLTPCVVTSYSVDRKAESGTALAVSLEFKVIRIVSTQVVTVPAQRRGQPPAHRAGQPPVTPPPTQNQSLLTALGVGP